VSEIQNLYFLRTVFALILSSYINQAYFSSSMMKIESYGILNPVAAVDFLSYDSLYTSTYILDD
jgi:hypothetical protein